MKILVSGSLAYDKIMNFPGRFSEHILPDKIHNLNVSFFIDKLKSNFGGTAGNIAYNLSLLGEEPIIIASGGSDFSSYQEWLKKYKIDTSQINIIKDDITAAAYIITDQQDNQLAGFYAGAMKQSCPLIMPDSQKYLAIIAPGNMDDMVNYAQQYKTEKIDYIFDPGQQIPMLSAENLINCITGAKAFISNDYELSLVMKKTGWNEEQVLEKVEILVTTLGEKGSRIKTKQTTYEIPPAKPLNTSDPTGAGDAYRAGFIKGLVVGWPLDVVGRFAGVVACYTVEKYGTQTHEFNLENVKERYKNNFNFFPAN